MGNQLNAPNKRKSREGEIPPWLDAATRALVRDIVQTLAQYRTDVLAIVLYGSVARHEERPVYDPHPSDVDLLAIFDSDDELFAIHEGKALFDILGMAYDRHLDILRDVKVMFASRTLDEWDPTFVANVAHDGLLLWARNDLSAPLAHLADVRSGRVTGCNQHTPYEGRASV